MSYNHETVALDGERFDDCEFRDCRLVYGGGAAPVFRNCKFTNCDWRFDGAAGNTLEHLRAMWAAGAKAPVQAMIKEITAAAT
ncbi:MAG TPA: hypothetical protein VFW47_00645 [Phenylobacterium sp.]|nr:hypothetical protein [Phenylobacterium sp.]